jgi:hypothetical protein
MLHIQLMCNRGLLTLPSSTESLLENIWFGYEMSPKTHVKARSPVQCSEVGFLESDWIQRALTSSVDLLMESYDGILGGSGN